MHCIPFSFLRPTLITAQIPKVPLSLNSAQLGYSNSLSFNLGISVYYADFNSPITLLSGSLLPRLAVPRLENYSAGREIELCR
jgi:hypothetical protein